MIQIWNIDPFESAVPAQWVFGLFYHKDSQRWLQRHTEKMKRIKVIKI